MSSNPASSDAPILQPRPSTHGRSVLVGAEKLHLRGATYGSFRFQGGSGFPPPEQVRADFSAMAASGLNALRTYTVPPRSLLDLAWEHGLRVMVGIPWEQHVAFLDHPGRAGSIAQRVSQGVAACAGHPAVLCYAIGNEIPASIVRWHGRRRVELFLEGLYRAAKAEDPGALVTYVNYPSTEYHLELPFLDLACFNVFLEDEATFEAYLARLQNLAGDRPLLVTESGMDSRRHGADVQARTLAWQIRHSFAMGAAGVFVFSWTDEWHRGGADIDDWDFGVVDRDRAPKPALRAVREAFAAVPFPPSTPDRRATPRDGAGRSSWPRISVVVCTHNGERTLAECLDRVTALRYPDYEVIVVSDGSTDASDRIASGYDCALVRLAHQGLGAARNAGILRSSGEIVAFLDDDAYPDPDWLHYLGASFTRGSYAALGGPNIPPPDDGPVASSVAAAPGGPLHVLTGDRDAEHIPGCNMAFRRSALEEVDGFDDRFRVAGDDVDICWRLQEAGYGLGFNAGAVVMHRRRDSVRRYLRQQYEYGKAEAILERKWPSRYNRGGSLSWSGRIYAGPARGSGRWRAKIKYGTWGGDLFQSAAEPARGLVSSLLAMPESYLLLVGLAGLAALGAVWRPFIGVLPLLVVVLAAIVARAVGGGWRAHPPSRCPGRVDRLRCRALTGALFLVQPLARLLGRLRNGLSPWRRRVQARGRGLALPRTTQVWSERWRAAHERILELERDAIAGGAGVRRGGAFDRWDLQVLAGPLASVRLRVVVEEHGSGRQLMRVRTWPRIAWGAVLAVVALAGFAVFAALDSAESVAIGLALTALGAAALAARDASAAMDTARSAVEASAADEQLAGATPGERTALAAPLTAPAADAGAADARQGPRPAKPLRPEPQASDPAAAARGL